MSAILIEHHTDTGAVEWVVGFGDPNPTADKGVLCANRDEASKLVDLVNKLFAELTESQERCVKMEKAYMKLQDIAFDM